MTEALPITRRKATQSETSFDSLRREAIKLIEQISGEVWTDYNLHDPGITILEQLIYAITDLIYRSEFAVEDYLVGEDGNIDLESLALHPPNEVFPCRATTIMDYRKLLMNAVDAADNVWLEAIPDQTQQGKCGGVYRLLVKLEQGLDKQRHDAAIVKLRTTYNNTRNLCEDLGDITVVKNIEYELCAEIEVSSASHSDDLLAEIYFNCARKMASSAMITSNDQALPFEELFDGPYTEHDFFKDDDIHEKQPEFQVSALFEIVNAIKGVDHIEALYLSKDGESYYDSILSAKPDQAFDLSPPNTAEDSKVVLKKNDRELQVDKQKVRAKFDELDFKYHLSRKTSQDPSLLYKPVNGFPRELKQYFSIQNQFPVNYGINAFGVAESAPTEIKAKARQLKSYLLIFEQILTNFLANLDSIKSLYSLQTRPQESYSFQPLTEQQINDLESVYPENPVDIFTNIINRFDNYNDRKNRLLNYLLALYGESFTQNSLRHFNDYYSKDEVEDVIINNKIAWLQSIVELGRDRAAAPDYSASSWEQRTRCGLQQRASLLLGFEQRAEHSLTMAILGQGINLCLHRDYAELKADSHELKLIDTEEIGQSSLNNFESPPLYDPDENITLHEIRDKIADTYPLKNSLLSDELLRGGIDIQRYRVGSLASAQDYQLTFEIDVNHEKQHWYLGSYVDKTTAIEAANYLRYFLLQLNKASEGLHIIEHILLRPQQPVDAAPGIDQDEDFFSFRISVIFPRWTKRCDNNEFRLLAEETLRLNVPAHIYAEFHWLDFEQMLEFEKRYEQWLGFKNEQPDLEKLDRSAQQLIAFLRGLRQSAGGQPQ